MKLQAAIKKVEKAGFKVEMYGENGAAKFYKFGNNGNLGTFYVAKSYNPEGKVNGFCNEFGSEEYGFYKTYYENMTQLIKRVKGA